MSQLGAVFDDYQSLQDAVGRLLEFGISDDQIQIMRRGDNPISIFPDDYDPFGGYRFTGTPVAVMAAAGENLTGNSATVDISLSMLPDLLAEAAKQEEESDKRHASYLLVVESDSPDIRRILAETGSEVVNVDDPFQTNS